MVTTPMSHQPKRRVLETTWPLFQEEGGAFPVDPAELVIEHAPPLGDLQALSRKDDPPDAAEACERAEQRLRNTLPPPSVTPEWTRAAQALVAELSQLQARGSVTPSEHAAIARVWAAWTLAGIPERQVLRVAHLVSRAHAAVRSSTQTGPEQHSALRAAAGVLHSRLPRSLQERMPVQRVVFVVYQLLETADAWAAVVEGTSELLGWKDYARSHAAAIIRRVMETAHEDPE
jgi:hypothetical protein